MYTGYMRIAKEFLTKDLNRAVVVQRSLKHGAHKRVCCIVSVARATEVVEGPSQSSGAAVCIDNLHPLHKQRVE